MAIRKDSIQYATFSEHAQKPSRVVNMKSGPPRQLPITPSVRKAINYRGPKSFSQVEIITGPSEFVAGKIPPKLLAASTLPSIDPEDPADERETYHTVSTKPSDNSVKTAELKSDDEADVQEHPEDEEEKVKVVHHQPLYSRITNVGESVFSKETYGINLSGLPRPHRAKPLPDPLSTKFSKTKEESKAALKISKAPDPFEGKYTQPEGKLQEMISNIAAPSNPLYYLAYVHPKSHSLQKAHRHFVISLFESIFLIKEKILKSESAILMPKVNLDRPKGLKCIVFVEVFCR